ncbi:MAG: hypothetical protein B5M53_02885 [Candidatus Cloacimonas sp. 4484_209]|nr:MAG: hypothetical protein B5M53_02885 [Candidatus Cloacimonas sp. 4484_209]
MAGKMGNNDEKRLEKEWLRFRGALYDHSVDFPTIPIVVDDVRKNTENFKKIGILFVDIIESIETIHGWQKFDMVVKRIANVLREIYSKMLKENDIIVSQAPRSGRFIIFIFSKDKGEQVDELFMQYVMDNIQEKVFRMTEDLREKYLFPKTICHIGFDFLYLDPVVRFERNLYSAIERARDNAYNQATDFWNRRNKELQRIIVNNDIQTVFQPILNLQTAESIGYEALTRITSIEFFNDTETLFSYAVQTEDPEFTDGRFAEAVRSAGHSEKDVVLEITERLAIKDLELFKKTVKKLKSYGFAVAIDDVGAGYSTLHTIAELKPNYLKYDMALGLKPGMNMKCLRIWALNMVRDSILQGRVPF